MPNVTWQWQLDGTINTEHVAEVYDVHLFERLVCPRARSRGMRTLMMPHNLDDQFRVACF